MKALVKYAAEAGSMEIREYPVPVPGATEVLVKVKACGVDKGGDLYIWKSHPVMKFRVPVIVGAENCGEVAAVGSAVMDWNPGDRVTAEVVIGKEGGGKGSHGDTAYLFQSEKWDLGRNVDGGFAEYFVVDQRFLHAIPDSVSWRAATLFEMAAVAIRNLLEVVQIPRDRRVAIIGPGPIGQISAQIVRWLGGTPVIFGLERDADRFALASSLGFREHVIVDRPDFDAQVARYGETFPYVVEASGGVNALPLAIQLASVQGTVAVIGGNAAETPVSSGWFLMKELTMKGSYAHTWSSWEKVAELAGSGALDLEPLYTGSYSLEDWEVAFREVDTDPSIIKVGLCPGELI
ncbi:zinc-dependent alcohol dehydrogenase [Protaetiibacter intestinalis]|nr:alcohol dehydrogenase catalytic domain-containing protein [Protaetiibacter intestinalis]